MLHCNEYLKFEHKKDDFCNTEIIFLIKDISFKFIFL